MCLQDENWLPTFLINSLPWGREGGSGGGVKTLLENIFVFLLVLSSNSVQTHYDPISCILLLTCTDKYYQPLIHSDYLGKVKCFCGLLLIMNFPNDY